MPLDRILRNLIAWQRVDGPPVPAREQGVAEGRKRYHMNAVRPRREGGGPRVASVDRDIDASDGAEFRCRTYTPENDRGILVSYLHGGGWALGDIDTHDHVCRIVAAALGAVVVSADYRRAPEFPYPVPLLDAIAAARWAGESFPGRTHVLVGDSAGAALALGAALDARDRGGLDLAALLLLYPPTDPQLLLAAKSPYAEGYLLTVEEMVYHYDLYVPDPQQRLEGAVDLRHADLGGLPPTVVATAEFDPLHDEGAELAERLALAGVPVRHVPGPGLVHGYFLMQDIVPAAAARSAQVLTEFGAVLDAVRGTHEKPAEAVAAE